MPISLHLDNIIYQLQKAGGASLYWQEITSRIIKDDRFSVRITTGEKKQRFFSVYSRSQVFHSSHFRTSFPKHTKVVSTIHDLTYERKLIQTSALGSFLNIRERTKAIEKADAIICISDNTKREMLELYPWAVDKQIHVIWHGCSFSRSQLTEIKESTKLLKLQSKLKKFALYVGNRNSYKNFQSALVGFAKSSLPAENFSLVCTGPKFTEDELATIAALKMSDNVISITYASNIELSYLYQNAFALLYTSTYEGFGLPPLESISCGTPVIAANASSIPEIVGGVGILLDDITDYHLIAKSLDSLLDPIIRQNYVEKGLERSKVFSWDNSAEAHMKVYESLV
jgi:glycosyltransferase involved in cell wall biosynthesis